MRRARHSKTGSFFYLQGLARIFQGRVRLGIEVRTIRRTGDPTYVERAIPEHVRVFTRTRSDAQRARSIVIGERYAGELTPLIPVGDAIILV